MDNQFTNDQVKPTVFDKFLEPVQPFVEEQSQRLTPHHNEKFPFQKFFRLLIYFFVSEYTSIRLLIDMLQKGLIPSELNLGKVPYSTFSDAFERFSSDIFKAIFIGLLSTITLKAIPELQALGILYCVDGSLFPTLTCMLWAKYKKSSQSIKLHLCYELNRMIPVEIIVGSGNSSERNALLKMLKPLATYIADRGYAAFRVFHEIVLAQAHFIIRVKSNFRKTVIESLPVVLPEKVKILFQEVTDQIIRYKKDPYGHSYRLVCFRVGTEIFHLLTDRIELTTIQIITLYAYRWQIELIFRFLKRTMNGIHLIKNIKNGVTIQFYIMLIVALLQLKLKQDVLIQNEQNQNQSTDIDSNNDTKAIETIKSGPGLDEEKPISSADSNIKNEPIDEKSLQDRENDYPTVSSSQPENKNNMHSDEDISHPYQFFEMIGEKLKKYWKIGIHWLTALRNMLHLPFDARAIEILDSG
jgi:hypothetical protein